MKTPFKYLLLACLALPLFTGAQSSLDTVLAAVRANNKSLKYARLQMEAGMRDARTGIYLPNPEVQFDYLWGDPASSGNRTDFGITQEFEFPGVYIQRANRSGLVKTGSTLSYAQKETEIVCRARLTWIELVGLNRQLAVTGRRAELAESIAQKAGLQLSRGDINAISRYHAQLEAVNFSLTRTELEMKRAALLSALAELCGGIAPEVSDTLFAPIAVPTLKELEENLSNLPLVRSMENEVRVQQAEKSIAVQEWFPKFRAGYYSETVTGLRYQGIVTGISIPLWERSNTVATATVKAKSLEAGLDVVRQQQLARIRTLFDRQAKLSSQVEGIRSALNSVDLLGLLAKALESGEISIPEYYYETSVYYSALLGLIKTEQELASTRAELLQAAGF